MITSHCGYLNTQNFEIDYYKLRYAIITKYTTDFEDLARPEKRQRFIGHFLY